MKDYQRLIENINRRANPEGIILEKAFIDELGQLPYKYANQYVKRAMRGVEPEYTQRSIEAGNKVRDSLKEKLSGVVYKFQGSVMTNTHIKGYSDIDLLAITEKFYTFDREGISKAINESGYFQTYSLSQLNRLNEALKGGGYDRGLNDLKELREDCESILSSKYTYVNIQPPIAINVELTNPKRNVDVAIASWYKDAEYYIHNEEEYKGVQVYDKINRTKLPEDYPFLSIKRINDKDSNVNGRLKKMIRFLKTVKSDSNNSENIKLSSFDFNAISYDIDIKRYSEKDYLELAMIVYENLLALNAMYDKRFNLKSVDGKEFVFRDKSQKVEDREKVESLKIMIAEIAIIINDINVELRRAS